MDNYLDNIAINTDSTTIEGEIKTIINGTRQILTRLGPLLTNNERKKITKDLYESLKKLNNTDKNTRLRKKQKENMLKRLISQYNILFKKVQFMNKDYSDLQYHGITDLKHMYNYINKDSYYDYTLIESFLEKTYELYQINGDKDKELSVI